METMDRRKETADSRKFRDHLIVKFRLRSFTLKKVAEIADCSVATVSSVLRKYGKSDRMPGGWWRYAVIAPERVDIEPEQAISGGAIPYGKRGWQSVPWCKLPVRQG